MDKWAIALGMPLAGRARLLPTVRSWAYLLHGPWGLGCYGQMQHCRLLRRP